MGRNGPRHRSFERVEILHRAELSTLEALGLTYMQARFYDPVIGRFLSTDPVGFSPDRPDMFGRYTYVANDPVNMIDPDGELANFAIGFVVGAAIDVAVQTIVEGKSLSKVDFGQALVAGGVGAVSGGLGGGAAKGVASVARAAGIRGAGLRTAAPKVLQGAGNGAVSGGVSGGTQSAITQQLETGQIDLGEVAKDAAFGAVAGAIGGAGSGSAKADASKAAFGDARGRAIFNKSQPGAKTGAAAGVATEGGLNAGRALMEKRDQ